MINQIFMKKLALGLFIAMIASFSIAACIASNTGGYSLINQSAFDVDETRSFSVDGLSEINVNCSSPKVSIIPIDGSEVIVHLYGKSSSNKAGLDTSVAGKSLMIKYYQPKTYIINLSKTGEDLRLDVSIPRTYTSDIVAGTSSGDLNIEGFNLNKLVAETSSGNLYMKSFTSQNCELRSSSGNISVDNGSSDSFRGESSSGEIKLSNLQAKDSVCTSSSGAIVADKITGSFKADSSSGEVIVQYIAFENDIDISTSSGEVSIRLPQPANFILNAQTSSGAIRNTFPLAGYYDRNHMTGTVGNGVNKINLVTTSGDISISD
ncbi:MAG: DUF4097 family beta strand repeat-containing protein [Syntrophomonas sp.]